MIEASEPGIVEGEAGEPTTLRVGTSPRPAWRTSQKAMLPAMGELAAQWEAFLAEHREMPDLSEGECGFITATPAAWTVSNYQQAQQLLSDLAELARAYADDADRVRRLLAREINVRPLTEPPF